MGVVSDTYGTLLGPVSMQMIPEDVASSFSRVRDEDETLDVNRLVQFSKKEAESRERSNKNRSTRKREEGETTLEDL